MISIQEAAYIKQTVGPILSEALTSLVLHKPHTTSKSPFDTRQDAITYIATYLLQHDAAERRTAEMHKEKEKASKKVAAFSEMLKAEKDARARLNAELKLKTVEIAGALEAKMAAMAASAAAAAAAATAGADGAAVNGAEGSSSVVDGGVDGVADAADDAAGEADVQGGNSDNRDATGALQANGDDGQAEGDDAQDDDAADQQ